MRENSYALAEHGFVPPNCLFNHTLTAQRSCHLFIAHASGARALLSIYSSCYLGSVKNRSSVGGERELNECASFRLPSICPAGTGWAPVTFPYFSLCSVRIHRISPVFCQFFWIVTGQGPVTVRIRQATWALPAVFSLYQSSVRVFSITIVQSGVRVTQN